MNIDIVKGGPSTSGSDAKGPNKTEYLNTLGMRSEWTYGISPSLFQKT